MKPEKAAALASWAAVRGDMQYAVQNQKRALSSGTLGATKDSAYSAPADARTFELRI